MAGIGLGWAPPRSPALVRWRARLDSLRFDRRRDQILFGAIGAAILLIPARELLVAWPGIDYLLGRDFGVIIDATGRWLGGGEFYPRSQLAGPFIDDGNIILYPPTALWLFAPLALLPRDLAALLWFGLPVVAVLFQIARLRPASIAWPFLAICLAWPPTLLTIVVGNPAVMFVALLALGTIYRWPSAFILVKTGVAPFALWGANRGSWWVALAVLAAAGVVFGELWIDWLIVIANSRVGGVFHSIQQYPLFLIPVLVWFARDRTRRTADLPIRGVE